MILAYYHTTKWLVHARAVVTSVGWQGPCPSCYGLPLTRHGLALPLRANASNQLLPWLVGACCFQTGMCVELRSLRPAKRLELQSGTLAWRLTVARGWPVGTMHCSHRTMLLIVAHDNDPRHQTSPKAHRGSRERGSRSLLDAHNGVRRHGSGNRIIQAPWHVALL